MVDGSGFVDRLDAEERMLERIDIARKAVTEQFIANKITPTERRNLQDTLDKAAKAVIDGKQLNDDMLTVITVYSPPVTTAVTDAAAGTEGVGEGKSNPMKKTPVDNIDRTPDSQIGNSIVNAKANINRELDRAIERVEKAKTGFRYDGDTITLDEPKEAPASYRKNTVPSIDYPAVGSTPQVETPQVEPTTATSVSGPAATAALGSAIPAAILAPGAGADQPENPLVELQKKLESGKISANEYAEELRKLTSPDQPANPALGSAATTVETTLSAGTATSVQGARVPVRTAQPTLHPLVEKAASEYLSVAVGDGFVAEDTAKALVRQTQALPGTPEVQVQTMTDTLKRMTTKVTALREAVTAKVIEGDPSLAGDPDAINRAVDGEMAAILKKDKPHLLLRGEGTGVTSLAMANKELDDLLRKSKKGLPSQTATLAATTAIAAATEVADSVAAAVAPVTATSINVDGSATAVSVGGATEVANEAVKEAMSKRMLSKTFDPPESQKKQEGKPEIVVPANAPTDPASHNRKNDSIDPITRTKNAISDLFAPLRSVQPPSSDRSVQPPSSNVGLAESSPTSPLAGGNSGTTVQPPSDGGLFSKLVEQYKEMTAKGTGLGGYNNGGPPQTPITNVNVAPEKRTR